MNLLEQRYSELIKHNAIQPRREEIPRWEGFINVEIAKAYTRHTLGRN